jgi:hypothetical protein
MSYDYLSSLKKFFDFFIVFPYNWEMDYMKEEEWKVIQKYGVKTNYEISSHGRLRKTFPHWETNILTTKVIGTFKKKHNLQYKRINGEKFFINRLVAEAFIPIKNSKNLEINYIDGNIQNNYVENLKWVPRSIR